jgi:LysR family glycine cleavage system transcriptional activator
MKRGRLPLTALRSFEAAGRLQSFTAAAEELFVSQAAISRQIRDLEFQLGRPLFERLHRGVALTEAGTTLLGVLTNAFDRIDSVLSEIGSAEDAGHVTISSEPTFASLWLVPHLHQFRTQFPHIEVTIDSDPRTIEFRTHQAEIAIRHSEKHTSWPRTEAIALTRSDMIPVAPPQLVVGDRPIRNASDLLGHTLLHDENRNIWGQWFERAGIYPPENDRGPVLADGALVLQAVLRGHGVGLIDRIFADEEIDTGRIVPLFDVNFVSGGYFLVARDFSRLSTGAKCFVDWIRAEFGSF